MDIASICVQNGWQRKCRSIVKWNEVRALYDVLCGVCVCLYMFGVGWPKPILPNRKWARKHLKSFWYNWNNNIHKSALIDFWSRWVLNTIVLHATAPLFAYKGTEMNVLLCEWDGGNSVNSMILALEHVKMCENSTNCLSFISVFYRYHLIIKWSKLSSATQ